MSTAISTHHRLTHPATLIAAAATAVVVSGAAAVGYAMSQDDTASPKVSTTSSEHDGASQAGTGLHDFRSKTDSHVTTLKGGGTVPGLHDFRSSTDSHVTTPRGGHTVPGMP